MNLSAVYICPVRGMAGLEPPDPETAYQAARNGRDAGLRRLELPIFEEALDRPRLGLAYLDGLVKVLDAIDQAGLEVELAPLPRQLLGLSLGSRHIYKPGESSNLPPVFLQGKIRHLRRLNWWADPGLVSGHVRLVREAAAALSGHPALKSWLILDRHWSGLEVGTTAVDWLLLALTEEIHSRDEGVSIRAGLSWPELLQADLSRTLAQRVDGLRLAGLNRPPAWAGIQGPADELALAAYLGLMGQWLTGLDVSVEPGWSFNFSQGRAADRKSGPASLEGLGHRLNFPLYLTWPNLALPASNRAGEPPWLGEARLTGLGLLDRTLEPFDWLEPLSIAGGEAEPNLGFLDLDRSGLRADPAMHLERLFNHWLASLD